MFPSYKLLSIDYVLYSALKVSCVGRCSVLKNDLRVMETDRKEPVDQSTTLFLYAMQTAVGSSVTC
jgi:hypothetical protein